MQWDQKMQNLFNKLGNKHQITSSRVQYIIETFFRTLKKVLSNDDLPTVHIQNFGRFKADDKKLKNKLKSLKYQRTKKLITEEDYNSRVTLITNILNRLEREQSKRNF